MNVLPVITRELRAQARQPFTYWLRMLGLMAMLGVAGAFMLESGLMPGSGGRLFAFLHGTLLLSIWVLVPMSVADCLSQERREGTLGLLLLTPLRPWDIVLAKAAAHAFRAFTLWLVVLPVMALAFLQGGVGWREALLSTSINFSSLCLAIAVGVLASSYCKQWLRALSLAAILSGLAGGLMAGGKFLTLVLLAMPFLPGRISFPSLEQFLGGAGMYLTDWQAAWSQVFSGAGVRTGYLQALMFAEVASDLFVLSLTLGFICLAARNLRRRWRDEPPSLRAERMEKVFCQPVIGVSFLRGWMRRKLARNPIGWLEQRRWSGRLVTWAWFAVIISVQSAVLADQNFQWNYAWSQTTMALLLAGSMAASAAGSFRRERETGLLELLLVSPLTTGQVIGGRLRGLWGQFLPSILALLGIWMYFASVFHYESDFPRVWFFLITFAVMPVIGLYFSLSARNFISAFLLTLVCAFVLPLGVALPMRYPTWRSWNAPADLDGWNELATQAWFLQLGLAGLCLLGLHHKLATRSFPLERVGD
jgi:ABC-type transport system involved in multi-copper enzyme maturation permease subunit